MAKNLIIYGFSGFNHDQKNRMQTIAVGLEDCAVALLEDAVIGAEKNGTENPYADLINKNISFYCVVEDLKARGMDPQKLSEGISPIGYVDLIDLIDQTEKIISWL